MTLFVDGQPCFDARKLGRQLFYRPVDELGEPSGPEFSMISRISILAG
jgi:hypothetical protein